MVDFRPICLTFPGESEPDPGEKFIPGSESEKEGTEERDNDSLEESDDKTWEESEEEREEEREEKGERREAGR
ncbi:hypothetical protein MSHOH_1752 [Methanosarcina horonobensis HB-1 = JCM 15518]|uniref:Uncharacterized protein n=1 Tax=Methanosarcina horonobensis HB-1 = JCM 15518 TaxID=1434110 RepID=A0A0E3WT99_9EURY|nr:hypothetical protein [Methanosarcina horonobensis]AKB78235.1 hypothetical protein MSHOH_1752 [Methanosarcina horonobensis HB-1 = JCM 15518]